MKAYHPQSMPPTESAIAEHESHALAVLTELARHADGLGLAIRADYWRVQADELRRTIGLREGAVAALREVFPEVAQ